MDRQAYSFRAADLVGGHVVLDLVNTVTGRDTEPVDWLDGYTRALEWARLTGHFDRGALTALDRLSAADGLAAARALERLRGLRETLHDALVSTIADGAADQATLARVEARWKEAVGRGRLEVRDGRAELRLQVDRSGLDYLGDELALRAVELLAAPPRDRLRVCAGTRCSWLFVDRSKAGRRRWCDMATCGNAAKSRRHYERLRARRGHVAGHAAE
jgi:predicted RNA-binding Zn ribbon-like protein